MRTNGIPDIGPHASFLACALTGAISLLGAVSCGGGSDDVPAASAGSGGSSTNATGQGGASSAAGGASVTSGGASGSGASSAGSASAGTSGSAGSGEATVVNTTPGVWTDVGPSGAHCSGVMVNRVTGDVLADVHQDGIWKSTDQATTWTKVDGGAVGGIAVMGPALDVDQNEPTRIAAWSLDGDAGWTTDGSSWKKMAAMGRNWDFGATDWATPEPKTLFGSLHESSGAVYLSTDGAASWNKLSITVLASGAGWPPPAFAMVGVMDATTLIYGNGDGIYRSADSGVSFTKVSDSNVQTRVPVLFDGVFYLGGEQGLVVSSDKGATWQAQGSELFMWVGPFFGADQNSMVAINTDGVYETSDAGTTWNKVASAPSDPKYDPRVFGGYAWDPIHAAVYAAAVDTPLLKMQL